MWWVKATIKQVKPCMFSGARIQGSFDQLCVFLMAINGLWVAIGCFVGIFLYNPHHFHFDLCFFLNLIRV